MSFDNDRDREGFRNRFYMLALYSSELNLVWERELHALSEDGHITDVNIINGKVVVVSYVANKKSKVYTFSAQYVTSEGKWENSPAVLDSFVSDGISKENKPKLIINHDQSLLAFSLPDG